jgi:hypothetical protein
VLRDLGVVYLPVPIGADLLDGRHCTDYKAAVSFQLSALPADS